MTTSISKRAFALLAAALLACALGVLAFSPQSAHAAQAGDTQLAAQAVDAQLATQTDDAQLATQATSSIYVRTANNNSKYAYNKKGLVTSVTTKGLTNTYMHKFKYSGTKLVKVVYTAAPYITTYSIKYDKKGRVKSVTTVNNLMSSDVYNNTETFYYNKKNQAIKKVTTYASGSPKTSVKYAYNTKGLVSKYVLSDGTKNYIKYDSKGSRTSLTVKYPESLKDNYHQDYVIRYKNTYKSGRLVKFGSAKEGESYYYRTIKYKKKSINKKYASVAKAQQQEFLRAIPSSMISRAVYGRVD